MKIKNISEICILREQYVINFCKKMNWNHKVLTVSQMHTIITSKDYPN